MAKLTNGVVAKALKQTHGNISAAARKLGVTRRAISYRIEKTPGLAQAVEDARETMVDNAETSLGKAVKRGAGWAVTFALKTQGRKRGYIEEKKIDSNNTTRFVWEDFAQEVDNRPVDAVQERINSILQGRNGHHGRNGDS